MKQQLLERGLTGTVFEGEGIRIEGEQIRELCFTLGSMEEAILALERRGVSLRAHANRMELETNRLPRFLVSFGSEQKWFFNRKDKDDYVEEIQSSVQPEEPKKDSDENELGIKEDAVAAYQETDFQEIRTINSGLTKLLEFGFTIDALLPQERTGMEDARYTITRNESTTGLEDLRELVGAVRRAGEKGMSVTRFKGLGEMNAEELRETTLDPENRTLIQVKMTNAAEADEMFRILMGDKVEPRREFIEKHALEVRNLDV